MTYTIIRIYEIICVFLRKIVGTIHSPTSIRKDILGKRRVHRLHSSMCVIWKSEKLFSGVKIRYITRHYIVLVTRGNEEDSPYARV